ncbi:hypothetical protein QYG89_12555 [Bacillus sp. B190/17]|uniref:Uncharacterized protein n=1 Tax=Bacillus lumedeiriae TaxID=3058829 RepID=A0ABW8IAF0_9BACI
MSSGRRHQLEVTKPIRPEGQGTTFQPARLVLVADKRAPSAFLLSSGRRHQLEATKPIRPEGQGTTFQPARLVLVAAQQAFLLFYITDLLFRLRCRVLV